MSPRLREVVTKAWTPTELIRAGEQHPRLFAPGTQFSYSTTGYIVLGLLAERAGGESYGNQLRDYITGPLHLSHTTLPNGTAGTPPDVHGYFALSTWDQALSSAPADITALSPTADWSGGGIRSTVQDVAAFYRALFSASCFPGPRSQPCRTRRRPTAPTGSASCRPAETPTSGGPARSRSTPPAVAPGATAATSPGYLELPISSPDGSRQAVLLVNADPSLIPQSQLQQVYHVLNTAYCQGFPS